jgi:hypothetical protein
MTDAPTSQLLFNGVLVVGQFFLPDEVRAHAKTIVPGDTCELEAEPTNQHDANAVMVKFKGQRVGYLPKEIAPTAALFLKNGFLLTTTVQATLVNKNKNFTVSVIATRPT